MWEDRLEERSQGLLPKQFFPLSPHPGHPLRPGHRAEYTVLGPLPGRDPDPSAVPDPGAGPPWPMRGERVPSGRRPPRPRPPPAAAAAQLPLPIFGAHTLQGAERAGLAETCPRAGPRVTDRGRHSRAARRGEEGQPGAPTNALPRLPDSGLIRRGSTGSPDRWALPPPRPLPSPHQTTAPPDPPFSFWRQTAAAAAAAAAT